MPRDEKQRSSARRRHLECLAQLMSTNARFAGFIQEQTNVYHCAMTLTSRLVSQKRKES